MPAETPAPLPACPFCGGEATFGKIQDDYNRDFGGEFISCDTCEISTGLRFATMEDVKPMLIAAWSRRVTPDAGVREALEKLLEWLNDPKLNGWSYMESSAFYMDKAEHLARINAALAWSHTHDQRRRRVG